MQPSFRCQAPGGCELGTKPSLGLGSELLTLRLLSQKLFTRQPARGAPVVGVTNTPRHIPFQDLRLLHFLLLTLTFLEGLQALKFILSAAFFLHDT